MRTQFGFVVAALALVAADAPKADPVKDELAKIQGTWRLASGERNGQKISDDEAKKVTRVITGDKYEIQLDGQPAGKGRMTVDPTKSPKTVDAEITTKAQDGESRTIKVLGIYELDGDTMKTCLAAPGKDRPTEFSSKEGSGQMSYVWKREKK